MEIRRSYDRLISTMGFPILVRQHLYIEPGPRQLFLLSLIALQAVDERSSTWQPYQWQYVIVTTFKDTYWSGCFFYHTKKGLLCKPMVASYLLPHGMASMLNRKIVVVKNLFFLKSQVLIIRDTFYHVCIPFNDSWMLTYWGWVMQICICKLHHHWFK